MTKIVHLNPHAEDFIAKPVSFALAKRRALTKYAYLLEGALKDNGVIDIIVDGTISSLLPQRVFMWLPSWMRNIFLNIELFFWVRLNQLEGKVNIHRDVSKLDRNSFLYLFSYKNCVAAFHKRQELIEYFKYKVINLSHYFIATKEKAQNIARLSNVILATEADIRENDYYKEFFQRDYPFLILPFQVGERFHSIKLWDERVDKCAATGSFHNLHEEKPQSRYQDFIKFFNMDSYHPVRKLIYRHKEEVSDIIDVKISPYREKKRNFFIRAIARFFDSSQKKYFSFNIVDFYNDHKSALIGEEIHGLPAIGSFEAMACGCALIAQGEYYKGLGFEEGKHYISHKGSLEQIRQAIKAVAEKEDALMVAKNGAGYVEQYCRSDKLWSNFQKKLSEYK